MWSRERLSVCAYFAILGIVCSAWASSIDEIKVLLGLDKRQLGWLLFSGPFGNLISFTFTSAFVARFGARRSVILASFAYLASASALTACFFTAAPIPFWCAAIALFGGSGNMVNISINAQAGLVEKQAGRQIMGSFHGVFSLMMFSGAIFTLTTTTLAIPVALRLLVTVIVAVLLHLGFLRGLPADEPSESSAADASGRWHRPDRALVAMGFAALVIMGCEASICDWVCVFFRDSLSATDAQSKWGFCAVTGMMAYARFKGDRLVNRFSASRVLHMDCFLVSLGLILALVTPFLPLKGLVALVVATAGYAVSGFGIAGMIPILYSKVNRTKAMPPASALTFVGSMGFFGYFFGPPLIGYVAESFNLSIALGLFAVFILSCLALDPDGSDG